MTGRLDLRRLFRDESVATRFEENALRSKLTAGKWIWGDDAKLSSQIDRLLGRSPKVIRLLSRIQAPESSQD